MKEDLFRLSCDELYVKYKNRHLHVFGRENVEGLCHFRERYVTEHEYKLHFKLKEARIRATNIKDGGYVVLKATTEPYVLFASNFHLIPEKETSPHYRVYVMAPDRQHAYLIDTEERHLSSAKLCPDNTLCMIVSTSPLKLLFREDMQCCFMLATPAVCTISLKECHLALWTRDHSYAWPLKYEVEDFLVHDGDVSYTKLYARYGLLFDNPPFCTQDMVSPAHGYVYFHTEDEVVGSDHTTGGSISRKNIKSRLMTLNQYATNVRYGGDDDDKNTELRRLNVYYKKGSATVPTFRSDSGEEMRVVEEERHTYDNTLFKLRALCRPGQQKPWCYFFVNRERTYLLFIPLCGA